MVPATMFEHEAEAAWELLVVGEHMPEVELEFMPLPATAASSTAIEATDSCWERVGIVKLSGK